MLRVCEVGRPFGAAVVVVCDGVEAALLLVIPDHTLKRADLRLDAIYKGV
jgi:hypothetical protein